MVYGVIWPLLVYWAVFGGRRLRALVEVEASEVPALDVGLEDVEVAFSVPNAEALDLN